jgi:hypothetical protein
MTENVTDIQIYVRIEGTPLNRAKALLDVIEAAVLTVRTIPGVTTVDWEAVQ